MSEIVSINHHLSLIECAGCGERIPLSRTTMGNQERIVEELGMARDLHASCAGASSREDAVRARRWREGFLRAEHNGGRSPDRLAYRA